MLMQSYAPGDPCPNCGSPLGRKPRMFFWRGDYYDGAVCDTHGLWPIAGEEIPPLRPSTATTQKEPPYRG